MRRILAITLGILIGACGPSYAQGVGSRSPFEFGFGSRDLALGGSSIANSDFTTAPFWNASRLADAQYTQFALFHSRLFDSDVGYQYAGIVIPTLDFGSFGLGVARLGVNGIEKRDAGNVLLGDVSDNRLGLFLAYGRAVAGYDLGLTLSLEHHSLDGYSATSSPGLDISLSRRFALRGSFMRGATLTLRGGNLVRPAMDLALETIRYPAVLSGGVAVDFGFGARSAQTVSLSARVDKSDQEGAFSTFGMEYGIGATLQLRGGYRDEHLSAGAGLHYRAFQFDYSVVGRDLGSLHMITLTTSLGRSKQERRAQRELARERDFSNLMNQRLREQNTGLVDRLSQQGDSALAANDSREALRLYDRALFLARSNGLDTTGVSEKATGAQEHLAEITRQQLYREYVDSAAATYERGEFVSTSYYADLASQEKPDGAEAAGWVTRAQEALAEKENREELIARELVTVDSLLSYGYIRQAVVSVEALRQFAPNHAGVQLLVNRSYFESYRNRAVEAQRNNNRRMAQVWLDSAQAIYPGHSWCRDFAGTLQQTARASRATPAAPARAEAAPAPSADMLREAKDHYEAGQRSFRDGDLPAAISEWEVVERIAPEYESVRSYLVKAYRLTGIDYYGRNLLKEAVQTWQRAYELDPDNDEIKGFIERTEAEIRRLGELSYEQ